MNSGGVFSAFPLIETPRLRLRQIELRDAEAMFATFSDEAVMEFYGQTAHRSVEDSVAMIQRQQQGYANHSSIRWGVTLRGEDVVIGSCGLFHFDEGYRRATIGYELRRAYWRSGIMSETLEAVLDAGFLNMGLHRIEAVVDDVNERSKGLLRKLGFTHEGTLRERFYFRERFLDEHYFGLLRDEWQRSWEDRQPS